MKKGVGEKKRPPQMRWPKKGEVGNEKKVKIIGVL
jgi:hypothetical protein